MLNEPEVVEGAKSGRSAGHLKDFTFCLEYNGKPKVNDNPV